MNVELTRKDLSLLNMMLDKELGDTRVEIRHADNQEYKQCLKDREVQIDSLLKRISAGLQETARAG